jgi:hypothetical protein
VSNRSLLASSALLLASLFAVIWYENRRPEPAALTPTLTGEAEYCVTCHGDLPEISTAHPEETFGCVICHGGERLALDADLAHSTMRGGRNPSDFSVVQASCGGSQCHSGSPEEDRDHIHRVLTSVQTTYAGAIAQIRFTYGAQPDLTARLGISAVQDDLITTATGLPALEAFAPDAGSPPSVVAFAENCLSCHLSAEPLPGEPYARLAGCAACHTPTAGADLNRPLHRLTTAIPYTQCNTCHNRGNYDLRDMQFHPREDQPRNRLQDYYQPIAQFVRCEWTLDCIDCHTRREAMGDGDLHSSKKEIQYVQCRTCHGTLEELPLTKMITDPEDLAFRLAFLNPVIDLAVGDTVIVTGQGEPLWNTRRLPDGSFELFGKATGQRLTFRPVMGSACQQKTDEQESRSCHACHAVER